MYTLGMYKMRSAKVRKRTKYKMRNWICEMEVRKRRKCAKRFCVRFTVCGPLVFNFCLSCDPFFGQRNVVYIACQHRHRRRKYWHTFARTPKNSWKKYFCGQLLRKIRAIFVQKRIRFRNIVERVHLRNTHTRLRSANEGNTDMGVP